MPSEIRIKCLGCGKQLKGKGELAGKDLKCPSCGHPIQFLPEVSANKLEKVAPNPVKPPPVQIKAKARVEGSPSEPSKSVFAAPTYKIDDASFSIEESTPRVSIDTSTKLVKASGTVATIDSQFMLFLVAIVFWFLCGLLLIGPLFYVGTPRLILGVIILVWSFVATPFGGLAAILTWIVGGLVGGIGVAIAVAILSALFGK